MVCCFNVWYATSCDHVRCMRHHLTNEAQSPHLINRLLLYAAEIGRPTIVRYLLSQGGAEVNNSNKSRCSPLWLAAQNGHAECLLSLVSAKADVHHCSAQDNLTPLCAAALNNHRLCVRLLCHHKADINHVSRDGTTPLLRAAIRGCTYGVTLLLDVGKGKGLDINLPDTQKHTPLWHAVSQGFLPCAQLLVAHNARIESPDLWVACERGHAACVHLLCEAKADVRNVRNSDLATPLAMASMNGHLRCVEVLLRHKADPNVPNSAGNTPAWFAMNHSPALVRTLIVMGNADCRYGTQKLLHRAVELQHWQLVSLLVPLVDQQQRELVGSAITGTTDSPTRYLTDTRLFNAKWGDTEDTKPTMPTCPLCCENMAAISNSGKRRRTGKMGVLLPCSHALCAVCYNKLLEGTNPRCPLCRLVLFPYYTPVLLFGSGRWTPYPHTDIVA